MRNNIFFKFFLFFIISLCIMYCYNISVTKYSIFNYFEQKSKINTLKDVLKKKQHKKTNLLTEIELLNDSKIIYFDIIEKETIKKLNKIPPEYYMIIE